VDDTDKLEAMVVSDAPGCCRQDPACGSPGAADQLRRRGDDRLADAFNADLASVAAAVGTRAARRARRRTKATRVGLLHDADPRRPLGKPVGIDNDAIVDHNGRNQRPARPEYASRSG
jgi:hypothetical protein